MSQDVATGLLAVLIGLATAVLGPPVMRRLPEPELDERPADADQDRGSRLSIRPVYEKVTYAELARRRFVPVVLFVLAAAATALLGVRVGWHPGLAVAVVAVPSAAVLGYIDARTTFLPTRLIYPTLLAALLTAVVVTVGDAPWSDLERGLIGCALYGGIFFVLWWVLPGYGFGDVRLAFLLGLVLGFLGWYELVTGFMLAQLLGGIGGAVLALLRLIDPRRHPFGPSMLVAALIGATYGPSIGQALGY